MSPSILVCTIAVTFGSITDAVPPRLMSDTEVSATGHYRLHWESIDEGGVVELQEARSPDFEDARTVYRGRQAATVMSGRHNGTYHYRLCRDSGPWSDAVRVTVQHHNLKEALSYMGVGAVVFLSTAVLIVCGHVAHRREESGT